MKSTAHSIVPALFVITLMTAQQNTAATDVAADAGPADPGLVSGSPWLWLLFVIVCIVVIFVLSRRGRGS